MSMDSPFNNSKAHYTLEEIEEAKKRQKKNGGTFMENLAAVAPGKAPTPTLYSGNASSVPGLEALQQINQMNMESIQSLYKNDPQDISSTIEALNQSIYQEFGIKETPAPTNASNASMLEKFNGITDTLKQKVYGQDDFLKKLVIAFKRPYVSERDHNDALNAIYITGPACTGKHYALNAIVNELGQRRVLISNEYTTMDLSIYPTAAEEKLFLQDLYSALQSSTSVIVFENYETCHISMLARLSDLVTTGECKLSERYMMQNGQLINVANAFAGNTVGSFEAKGKYLVFISSRPVDKLAGTMGAPFVNTLGDICSSTALDEESMAKIASEKSASLIEKSKKQLAYELTIDESFTACALTRSSKGRGLQGILDFYNNTLKALAELRLERDDLPSSSLTLLCREDAAIIVSGEEEIQMSSLLPESYNGELDAVKAEMASIVGLTQVKEYIFGLEEYFGVQKRRREAGLKAGEVNKHMIFTGNPGTGKTTIARIVSKYLKAIGVLSGGQLIEVSRADLVGRYVGHTAPLVNQVIKSAIGGVLFIDEAYSLHRGKDDNFGLEAIDTLVKGIEDNRDDLIVILAGYSNEMSEFLESNSGLKSRFPNIIDFPDYTGEELLAIGRLTAKSKGYVIDSAAEDALLSYFNLVQATRAFDAGNGRLVRNKIEEAIINQSRRLVAQPEADMSLLLEMDFDLSDK